MTTKRKVVYGTGVLLLAALGFNCGATYQASFINRSSRAGRRSRLVVRARSAAGLQRAVEKYYTDDCDVEAVVIRKEKERVLVESYQMETWYHLARHLYDTGEYREAAAVCRNLLDSYPGQLDSYILLGLSYSGMGAHRQGEEVIERVCAAHPEMLDKHRRAVGMFYLELADISSTGLQQEAAVRYYRKSLAIIPRNRAALEGLAAVYCRLGTEARIAAEYGPAEEYFRLALQAMPGWKQARVGQSMLWTRRGQAAFYANKPRAAVRAYRVALKLDPGNVRARKQITALYEVLARLYIKNREFDMAAHQLALALEYGAGKDAKHGLKEQLRAVREAQKGDERLVDLMYSAGPVLTVSPMDE